MTKKERKKRIKELLAELKELRATPRSDWHAAFEALLRIEAHRFESKVHIKTEEEIGEIPPRTDFVILIEDEDVDFGKEIFRIFRRINILEYKNPNDSLNERVIRKICGYANLYIGVAEHEGDRPREQVTISLFRATKNKPLFDKMERKGNLIRGGIPGIYYVKGITDLPFQIVITSELAGEEYAAYRALTDKAEEADVEQIINGIGNIMDDVVKEHYRVLLRLIIEKNPKYKEIGKGNAIMEDVLMEMVKDRVDREISEKVTAKEQETQIADLRNLMTNLKLSSVQAMDALSIPESQRETYRALIDKN